MTSDALMQLIMRGLGGAGAAGTSPLAALGGAAGALPPGGSSLPPGMDTAPRMPPMPSTPAGPMPPGSMGPSMVGPGVAPPPMIPSPPALSTGPGPGINFSDALPGGLKDILGLGGPAMGAMPPMPKSIANGEAQGKAVAGLDLSLAAPVLKGLLGSESTPQRPQMLSVGSSPTGASPAHIAPLPGLNPISLRQRLMQGMNQTYGAPVA